MATTLPTVGGNDFAGLDRSCLAFARLACGKRLEIVPPAGHLFAQPASLDAAIGPARQWFVTHLREEAAA
jgi:putative phosphoribosyl transferase